MPETEFTLGIEEEYQIVDAYSRALRPRSNVVLEDAQQILAEQATERKEDKEQAQEIVQHELYLSQIETASPVCHTLAEVRAQLQRERGALIAAAHRAGSQIVASGTHPFSHWRDQELTPKERYAHIDATFEQIARELIIFGCHVHVGIADRETALQVFNRARVWLSPLLALSANSPFWLGEDTGYASFRTELWHRFPMAGPPHPFADIAEYDRTVDALVTAGVIRDATNIYWDLRLSPHAPTIEFRVADVCLTIDEAVMMAGLVRGLARTCYEQAQRGEPFDVPRPELLYAAHWQAARYGLEGDLVDVSAAQRRPAVEVIEAFLTFIRPGLEAQGDWEEVASLVRQTLASGNGAMRQRREYARTGRLEAVLELLIAETARDTESVPQNDTGTPNIPFAAADKGSMGERPLEEKEVDKEKHSMPNQPPFIVQVTCDLINAIDGPGEYMEHERMVVLSVGEAERLKQVNPAIADYLDEEDSQHPHLLAETDKLTEMGFAALARQIDAEAERQVAAQNRRS